MANSAYVSKAYLYIWILDLYAVGCFAQNIIQTISHLNVGAAMAVALPAAPPLNTNRDFASRLKLVGRGTRSARCHRRTRSAVWRQMRIRTSSLRAQAKGRQM